MAYKKKKRPAKKTVPYDEKIKNAKKQFLIDRSEISDGDYIIGLDPPTTTNLGWCIFQYKDKKAFYIESLTEKLKSGSNEKERLKELEKFLKDLCEKYSPLKIFSFERALGRGNIFVRETLGENQCVIKQVAFNNNAIAKPVMTTSMSLLFSDSGSKRRSVKKTETCEMAKYLFGKKLEDRRVSKTGKFTHEADAIGFCVAFCYANDIEIEFEILEIEEKKIQDE